MNPVEKYLFDCKGKGRPSKYANPAKPLTKAIRSVLELHGWIVWKNGAGGVKIGTRFVCWGTPGMTDLACCKKGVTVFVEIKAGRDSLSKIQSDMHDALRRHGARVIVARSVADVEELCR